MVFDGKKGYLCAKYLNVNKKNVYILFRDAFTSTQGHKSKLKQTATYHTSVGTV